MSKIDTSQWGEFIVGEMFEIINGKGITKNELYEHPGKIAAIQSGEDNNGCIGYIDEEYCKEMGYYICKEPCLTVARSGSSGFIAFQENGCVCGDSAKILKPKYTLSRNHFLFLRALLMINKGKYHYNDKVSEKKYLKDVILLPVDKRGRPNWKYMEDYMCGIGKAVREKLDILQFAKELQTKKIDVSKFKRFHLYDDELFNVDGGTKLDRVKMSIVSPTINFVGRASANNGVTDFIDEIDGIKPYEAGLMTISLGGEYLGSCFIQDKPFYTSQNVCVLIPRHEMSYHCKKYIATMIFKEGRLHYKAFIDELNRHMKTDFSIPLPVDEKDNIDWDYMEQYMKNVEKKAVQTLECLYQ